MSTIKDPIKEARMLVKRFDPEITESQSMFHATMCEENHGDYVLFTDYESLLVMLDALVATSKGG